MSVGDNAMIGIVCSQCEIIVQRGNYFFEEKIKKMSVNENSFLIIKIVHNYFDG